MKFGKRKHNLIHLRTAKQTANLASVIGFPRTDQKLESTERTRPVLRRSPALLADRSQALRHLRPACQPGLRVNPRRWDGKRRKPAAASPCCARTVAVVQLDRAARGKR